MRVHLVDGTFELFRAWFSKRPPHRAPDGTDKKATLGVLASMLALVEDPKEQATHVAIAFDNPIRSFRNELFDGYKTEYGVPEELLAQFDSVEEAARSAGFVVWSMQRWEADDALASGAEKYWQEVEQVRILTPDKDLGQCLRRDRVVQVDRLRDKTIDEAALRAARGVGPESIPDLLALVGDDADGIPGVPGFGAKTAAALLAEYLHIEDIPHDYRRWKPNVRGAERLAASLAEHREAAALYKVLATLVRDVPLEESLDGLAWRGVPRAEYLDFCDRMGATTLKDRPKRWA